MRSSYKRIGDYITRLNEKNKESIFSRLLGININKYFMPSVANVVGTDLSKYKIVAPGQFACNRMHVGRDYRLPIALSKEENPFLVSPAYDVFKINDTNKLLPDYLMMWFSRAEFDRNSWFYTDTDVRGKLGWDSFCEMELPVPSIEKQQEIVDEYNTVVNRISLNEQLNTKLEETAQALYKHWFVENNSIEYDYLTDVVELNPKHSIKKGELVSYIEMACLQENAMSIQNIIKREYKSGTKFKNNDTLFARITPCLENGKTGFINSLSDDEIAYGSTEFIVMRAKEGVSPYWVYCISKDENFRSFAISSMVGSSGRQRVHSDYLKKYQLNKVSFEAMTKFHNAAKPIFDNIRFQSLEIDKLKELKDLLLSKLTSVGSEEELVTNT